MPKDYYQNILYPLQDKVLTSIAKLPVDFYLTGGTALSRTYLNHRYSDDLDFFVNNANDFKAQVNQVINAIKEAGIQIDNIVADDGFARMFVYSNEQALKLDFVNDVPFRSGTTVVTNLFPRTDNIYNILSNKITALGRYAAKDVVDLVFICEILSFDWEIILNDASEKDLWVNPINVVDVLEKFPLQKVQEIAWIDDPPNIEWFSYRIKRIITGILNGSKNYPA